MEYCESEFIQENIMSRQTHVLLAIIVCLTFCSSQVFAIGGLDDVLGGISKMLDETATGVSKSLGSTVDGVGRFVEGTANSLARSIGGTADGIGQFVGGAASGVGRSVDGTMEGLGEFVDGAGEVALDVAEVAGGVVIVAGVVFLYMMADYNCYHYGHGHGHGHGYYHYGR
jgi:phage-related protein